MLNKVPWRELQNRRKRLVCVALSTQKRLIMKTTFQVEVRVSSYEEAQEVQKNLRELYPHSEVILAERQEDDPDVAGEQPALFDY